MHQPFVVQKLKTRKQCYRKETARCSCSMFFLRQWLFDCYSLRLRKGQRRCGTGSHLST